MSDEDAGDIRKKLRISDSAFTQQILRMRRVLLGESFQLSFLLQFTIFVNTISSTYKKLQ